MGQTTTHTTHHRPPITFAQRWLRLLLHAPCVVCDRFAHGQMLCQTCSADLSRTRWGVNSLDLGQTRVPVIWREAYGGMLTDTVIRAKYFGNWGAAQMLGESLGQLPKPWLGATPVLIPIPLASRRLADRGFNQSMVIGKSLAKQWQLPIQSRWLRKWKPSARQASLSGPQRRHNLSGLFQASAAVRNQRVVLVDDIMTSGATLSEAARAIAHAGGQVVAAAVIARVATPPRRLQSGASPTPFVPHVQRRSL